MMVTMRALTKTSPAPGLQLTEVPEPVCGPADVKIRVLRAGLCGTDLHILDWDDWAAANVRTPLVTGHEFYGEVVEVGPQVSTVRVGDRASGEGHIVCNVCRNCRAGRRHVCVNVSSIGVHRDGAFADYVVLPETNVWVQHPNLDPDLGAIFDPLGNATHTALQWPLVGEDVVITGAGPIGVMAAAIARHAGARYIVVSDVNDERLELARVAGAGSGPAAVATCADWGVVRRRSVLYRPASRISCRVAVSSSLSVYTGRSSRSLCGSGAGRVRLGGGSGWLSSSRG